MQLWLHLSKHLLTMTDNDLSVTRYVYDKLYVRGGYYSSNSSYLKVTRPIFQIKHKINCQARIWGGGWGAAAPPWKLAGIYFLVHPIFVALKLWIWQVFFENFLLRRLTS